MDQELEALGMLDLMVRPGFCVKDQVIVKCNPAAESLLFSPGMNIVPMLATGEREYAEFTGGCLYLTVKVSGTSWGCSVTRMGSWDVFLLEETDDRAELQAMALAARELRAPLSEIMTTADQLFPMEALENHPELRQQAAKLNRGLYQMLRIIGNMSDAGEYAVPRPAGQEPVDIQAFFRELFCKMQDMIRHAGLTLRFENLDHSLYTLADRDKLERAVMNILSNALKFTAPGGTIDASLRRRGNRLYLSVQDTGEGIPDAIRSSIHQRYRRKAGCEEGRFGIGLGMVLIRSAAAVHGGAVLIDHPEGAGTRITMTLAIRQDASGGIRTPRLRMDYAGELDHSLIELSEVLPAALYDPKKEI